MKRWYGLMAISLLVLWSCESWNENKLCGKWQAISATENDMPLEIDANEIGFEFLANHYYNYRSTLNYKEAGTFSLDGDMLYTLDTINEASSEKAVKVIKLTKDSLFIKMKEEGQVRIIKLAKIK